MDGELMEPMLVCLQEKDGVFGPNVQRDMARPKNLHIVCTKSGLMDKQQILDWFEKIYFRKAQQSYWFLILGQGTTIEALFSTNFHQIKNAK